MRLFGEEKRLEVERSDCSGDYNQSFVYMLIAQFNYFIWPFIVLCLLNLLIMMNIWRRTRRMTRMMSFSFAGGKKEAATVAPPPPPPPADAGGVSTPTMLSEEEEEEKEAPRHWYDRFVWMVNCRRSVGRLWVRKKGSSPSSANGCFLSRSSPSARFESIVL